MGWTDVHVRGERVESFVEVVHLHQYAAYHNYAEHVCAWMCKLVVATQGEFDSDAESFDRHDRDGADQRTYGNVNQRG